MKLIIDISQESYKRYCVIADLDGSPLLKAIKDGIPLDKIRSEIRTLEYLNIEDGSDGYDKYIEQYEVLKILDKYKAESEGT